MLLQIFACIRITSRYFWISPVVSAVEHPPIWPQLGQLLGALGELLFKWLQSRSPSPSRARVCPGREVIPHWHFPVPFHRSISAAGFIGLQAYWTTATNEVEGNQKHRCLIRLHRQCTGSRSLIASRTVHWGSCIRHRPLLSALPFPAAGWVRYVTPNFLPYLWSCLLM